MKDFTDVPAVAEHALCGRPLRNGRAQVDVSQPGTHHPISCLNRHA
jgi:hypothetical protein